MKIAEPRTVRLIYFVIYGLLGYAGCRIMRSVPSSLEDVIGHTLVVMLGIFMSVGALMCLIAILPGIWWLERVGIILLWTGLIIYLALVVFLGSSPLGIAVSAVVILFLLIRWIDIKDSQLAPRKD